MVSLQAALELGDGLEAAFEVDAVSMAVAGQGRHRKGILLHAAADEKLNSLGADLSKVDWWLALRDRYLTPARLALGASFADADDEGRAMGFNEAVNYAANPDLD